MRTVKSREGSIRAVRAAETEVRILDAARVRFRDRGYAATTLREIAEEAGVAVQTVYAVFGSKADILRALRLRVVGDPGADAAWGHALQATTTDGVVTAFARSIRLRWEGGADIVAINMDAASADPAIREEVARVERVRRTGIGEIARVLVAIDGTLGGVDRLTALIEALTTTSAYAVLRDAHGWSADEYEEWLAGALADAIARTRAER